jgi:hypothetical protein
MSWFLRKAIGLAKVTLKLTHKDGSIETLSQGTGVPMSVAETITLDWTERDKKLPIFGAVKTRNRTQSLGADVKALEPSIYGADAEAKETEEDLAWLLADWIRKEDGGLDIIESQVVSTDAGWVSHQVWGFEVLEGKREQVRKVVLWKGNQKTRAHLVYQYLGPNK